MRDIHRIPFVELFRKDLWVTTLLCWVAFFGAFFTLYFILSWNPRIATNAGYPLATAINGSAIYNAGAIVGLASLGWITAKWQLGKVMAVLYFSGAVAMLVFAQWNAPETVFFSVLCVQQGANGALYAAAAQAYETRVKTTGFGWAIGVGRAGAVLGPIAGGFALSAGMSVFAMFILFSLPLLLSAACGLALARKADEAVI